MSDTAITSSEAGRILLLVRKERRRLVLAMDREEDRLMLGIMAESHGDLLRIERKLEAITHTGRRE